MPAPLALGHRLENQLALVVGVGDPGHLERDVVALETGDDQRRVPQAEPADDVVADRRGRGRGHRDDPRRPELGEELGEPEVVRPEVVAPARHAVRLVDRDEAGSRLGERAANLGVRELLGGEEEELQLARRRGGQRLRPLPLGLGRAEPGGPELQVLDAEPLDLVLLQREQRRHDDGAPVEEDPGHLVAERLAGAGRRHEQHVAAPEQGAHRLLLAGKEVGMAEEPFGGTTEPGHVVAGLVGARLGGHGRDVPRARRPQPCSCERTTASRTGRSAGCIAGSVSRRDHSPLPR